MQTQSLCTWNTLTAISICLTHDMASALRVLCSSASLPALTSWYCITASRISLRQLSSSRNTALTVLGSGAESSCPYQNSNTILWTLMRLSLTLSHSPLHALTACNARYGLVQRSHCKTIMYLDDRDGCTCQSCHYLDIWHLVQHLTNGLYDPQNHGGVGGLVPRRGIGDVIFILGSHSLSTGKRMGGGGGAFV